MDEKKLSDTPDRQSGPGLVEVFTGNGKGKTSAALGIALRAAGHGMRVHIIFFMKGDYPYGEREAFSHLVNVDVSHFGQETFVDPSNVRAEEIAEAKRGLDTAREVIQSGNYDIVVLDEINVATAWKLLDIEEVLELLRDKPRDIELILTGRYADRRLVDAADLVTEMVNLKHPYDRGILSRKGLDY
ncbi:MAG TPA: cob(I)yrinic acid a,c-diamide adenosyltransferase [Dehalococcoidia bacterium]|nr:cob(I)yrinic acid a,c-diamide adenosyltransferase [Dehalococcoidia bacterium]